MERELSVAVLGDTKLFEKSYKSRICSIIEEYAFTVPLPLYKVHVILGINPSKRYDDSSFDS